MRRSGLKKTKVKSELATPRSTSAKLKNIFENEKRKIVIFNVNLTNPFVFGVKDVTKCGISKFVVILVRI